MNSFPFAVSLKIGRTVWEWAICSRELGLAAGCGIIKAMKKFLVFGVMVGVLAAAGFYLFTAETWAPAETPTSAPGETESLTVKAFFGNSGFNPNVEDCSLVYPVSRKVAKTQAVGKAALEELLKGPTEDEKQQGYYSSLNSGVKLQSLVIENGVAKADFDEQLGYQVGGSCLVGAIRSEISQTLKQFPTVNEVIISINGETELILQP